MSEEKTCNDCAFKRPCPCGEDDCEYYWCNKLHHYYADYESCEYFLEKEKENE